MPEVSPPRCIGLYGEGVTNNGAHDWPIRIRGKRILIREAGDADRPRHIELMTDPVTREYLGGSIAHVSPDALELAPLGLSWGRWVIARADDDRMLGLITLDYDREELQLSYALLPDSTGQGYAAEACRTLLAWAQTHLTDDIVIAVTPTRNKRSVHLLGKLGFTVRRGLEEFGAHQLLMERSLAEPLPELAELGRGQSDAPLPPSARS